MELIIILSNTLTSWIKIFDWGVRVKFPEQDNERTNVDCEENQATVKGDSL